MAQPVVESLATQIYTDLEPVLYEDEKFGWTGLLFISAVTGTIQDVDDIVRDQPNQIPGWGKVLDPDIVPDSGIAWLGQLVGVRSEPRLPTDPQEVYYANLREKIKARPRFSRGNTSSLITAAQDLLTGNKTVYLFERDGSPWQARLTTFASETPDAAKVNTAIQAQKPAGIILTHAVVTGGTYDTLRDLHADFNDISTQFANFDDATANPTLT